MYSMDFLVFHLGFNCKLMCEPHLEYRNLNRDLQSTFNQKFYDVFNVKRSYGIVLSTVIGGILSDDVSSLPT